MLVVTSRKKIKKIIRIAVVLLILFLLVLYFFNVTRPLIVSIAEAEAKQSALNAVNQAAAKIRKMEAFYGDYYTYEKNKDGEVVLITANTANINQMYISAQTEIQSALNTLTLTEIPVPLGALTGSSLLSTIGPDINLHVKMIGTSESVMNSFYYNEGINQTIHRLVLRVQTKLKILIPLKAAEISISTDLVLAEDIIIGRVPETYVSGILKENVFDLLP